MQCVYDHWNYPALSFAITFLIVSNLFAILDYLQPLWYMRLAVSSIPIRTFTMWYKLFSNNIRNLLFSYWIGGLAWYIRIELLLGCPDHTHETWYTYLIQLQICYIGAEVWFYFSHYTVHQFPKINRYVHAQHHEFIIPIAMVGLYATCSEMLLINLPFALLPGILMGCESWVMSLWLMIIACGICLNHCSHQILPRWLFDAEYHIIHHKRSYCHFGADYIEKRFL